MVVQYDLELDQLNVKTAFMHGDLDEIFMTQPVGFKVAGKKKSDLQAEEVTKWAEAIAETMVQAIWQLYTWQKYTRSKYDPCV